MRAPRSSAVATFVISLAVCAPAGAQAPPLHLPGDASVAGVRAERSTWVVGARPGAASARVARSHGARHVAHGTWLVRRSRARALAAALRRQGTLVFAEPNRYARRTQGPPPDPRSQEAGWRDFVVDPNLAPPPVGPDSPLLALIDAQADLSHPEFGGGNVTSPGGLPVSNPHGTATAAVAAAPANGVGILGVWPGMRAVNVPMPDPPSCADSARQISASAEGGASVINMSYGSPQLCFAEYVELQAATARGVTAVAAAGNEFAEGNPLEFPASLPHVITVAAVGPDLRSSFFSNASAAVDVAAPGERILTAVPGALDEDGNRDGYTVLDGTSFAAPMVAAGATWVRAARPDLAPDQVAAVLRASARDLEPAGYDPNTGHGLITVGAALTQEAPPRDALEPNDDIVWVDGRAFGRPDTAVWRGRGVRRVGAFLDRFEDPHDVYRVTVPARRAARVTVRPGFGDADLAVFSRSARGIGQTSRRLGVSRRRGTRIEAFTIRNRTARARTSYVHVHVSRATRRLDASYLLTVRRAR